MARNFFALLQAGPPPPKAVLLPDGLFFIRAVPVNPQDPPEEVARQVEVALEAGSPFPLAQLYYGHHWQPGSARALAFAAYRRRFTPEQAAGWAEAELVLPAFAALLGAAAEPATTVLLASPEGLTAIHWADGPVPAQVRFVPLSPEPDEEKAAQARAQAREALLRRFESKTIVDLAEAPVADPSRSDRETVFRDGDFVSRLPAEAAAALDIRDKDELRHLRAVRGRSLVAWRVLVGIFIAAGVLAVGELLIVLGGLWQTTRLTKMHAQVPVVDQIMTAQSLTHRIDVLSTKQLLPMEMIGAIVGKDLERKPASVQFISASCASTADKPVLTVRAQTDNPGDINVYQNTLSALPECAKVETKEVRASGGVTNFTLVVTFKAGALKPGGGSSS
ncbi:MAG TPA: hypothetical protein VHV47_00215 [Opitutaceae bacterium]|jgi:hypothetical protein|nr:hypothetical protein [Opitutaceae bacterium]